MFTPEYFLGVKVAKTRQPPGAKQSGIQRSPAVKKPVVGNQMKPLGTSPSAPAAKPVSPIADQDPISEAMNASKASNPTTAALSQTKPMDYNALQQPKAKPVFAGKPQWSPSTGANDPRTVTGSKADLQAIHEKTSPGKPFNFAQNARTGQTITQAQPLRIEPSGRDPEEFAAKLKADAEAKWSQRQQSAEASMQATKQRLASKQTPQPATDLLNTRTAQKPVTSVPLPQPTYDSNLTDSNFAKPTPGWYGEPPSYSSTAIQNGPEMQKVLDRRAQDPQRLEANKPERDKAFNAQWAAKKYQIDREAQGVADRARTEQNIKDVRNFGGQPSVQTELASIGGTAPRDTLLRASKPLPTDLPGRRPGEGSFTDRINAVHSRGTHRAGPITPVDNTAAARITAAQRKTESIFGSPESRRFQKEKPETFLRVTGQLPADRSAASKAVRSFSDKANKPPVQPAPGFLDNWVQNTRIEQYNQPFAKVSCATPYQLGFAAGKQWKPR